MPFFRLPRIPEGVGHSSSVLAIGLWGLRIVSRRSGGGKLNCCKALRSWEANSPRRFSADAPMSSPDSALRAGEPLVPLTSLSLAVRKDRCAWALTLVQELAGRAGDAASFGRRLSIDLAVSTLAATKYCPLVIAVRAVGASHSSWLELDVPLRENVLVLDTKLRSLYCVVDMLEVASADSEETCCRMTLSSSDECPTRAFRELKAASFSLRHLLSSSSSSILATLQYDTYATQ